MKQIAILIRGIPGSGKSTIAKMLCDKYPGMGHYEADMFFLDTKHEYKFDASKLPQAHAWCFRNFVNSLSAGHDVIVSNTFTKVWEMQRYIDYCYDNNINLLVFRCTGNFQNVHGVPEEKVQQMRDRFEDHPGEIIVGN